MDNAEGFQQVALPDSVFGTGSEQESLLTKNNVWKGTNEFDIIPICKLTPTDPDGFQLANKNYVDTSIAGSTTHLNILDDNNVWKGTNLFQLSCPQSSIAPTTAADLTRYDYVNNKVDGLLTSTNTWSGNYNNFKNTVILAQEGTQGTPGDPNDPLTQYYVRIGPTSSTPQGYAKLVVNNAVYDSQINGTIAGENVYNYIQFGHRPFFFSQGLDNSNIHTYLGTNGGDNTNPDFEYCMKRSVGLKISPSGTDTSDFEEALKIIPRTANNQDAIKVASGKSTFDGQVEVNALTSLAQLHVVNSITTLSSTDILFGGGSTVGNAKFQVNSDVRLGQDVEITRDLTLGEDTSGTGGNPPKCNHILNGNATAGTNSFVMTSGSTNRIYFNGVLYAGLPGSTSQGCALNPGSGSGWVLNGGATLNGGPSLSTTSSASTTAIIIDGSAKSPNVGVDIKGIADFSTNAPTCSIAPTLNDQLVNKSYVDGHSGNVRATGIWWANRPTGTDPDIKLLWTPIYTSQGDLTHFPADTPSVGAIPSSKRQDTSKSAAGNYKVLNIKHQDDVWLIYPNWGIVCFDQANYNGNVEINFKNDTSGPISVLGTAINQTWSCRIYYDDVLIPEPTP